VIATRQWSQLMPSTARVRGVVSLWVCMVRTVTPPGGISTEV
jgi:hypothetical protein